MGGAEEINSQKNTDKAQHRIEYIESTKRCITKYVHKFFFPLLLCYSALGGTNDDGSMELNGGHHGCPRVTINSVPLSLFSSPSCLLTTTPVFLCLMSIRSVYIHRGQMYCPFFPIVNGKADLLYGLIQRSGHLYGGHSRCSPLTDRGLSVRSFSQSFHGGKSTDHSIWDLTPIPCYFLGSADERVGLFQSRRQSVN